MKHKTILSAIAVTGILAINALSPQTLATEIEKNTNQILKPNTNIIQDINIVPIILGHTQNTITIKDIQEKFQNINELNGAEIESIDTRLKTGDTFTVQTTPYTILIYGDVNQDGKVNVLDASKTLKEAVKLGELNPLQKIAADVENIGANANKINVLDAARLLKFSVATKDTTILAELPEETDTEEDESTEVETPETKTVSGFYYEQLNPYEQLIYNAVVENKENLKNGTYEVTITGETLKSLRKQHERQRSITNVLSAFLYSNPDMFFMDALGARYNSTTVTIYPYEGTYFTKDFKTEAEVRQASDQIEAIKEEVLSSITGTTDYEKILQVHNWLVKHNEYDETYNTKGTHTIYGPFINDTSICDCYSKSM